MLDQDDLVYLARRRWRRGAPPVEPGRVVFLALLLVLHLGALLFVRANSLRARPPPPHDDVLVVRLLPPERQDEPLAEVAPQARDVVAKAPRAGSGGVVEAESDTDVQTAPVDGAYLFNPDGSLKLPKGALDPEPTAFRNPEPAALPAPRNPVPYRATRFDAVWVKDHETLGERLVRKSTVVKTFDSNGTRITCAWTLFAPMMAGCGWGLTPREPPKPAPWLAVAGETRPETPIPFDPDPFD